MATTEQYAEELSGAQESLDRIINFDASSLSREKDLGTLAFNDAIKPARKLIDLYKQLPDTVLGLLTIDVLREIKQRADADFNLLDEILKFDLAKQPNPQERRNQLIDNLRGAYDSTFAKLHQWIAYSIAVSTDFRRLEDEARAAVQAAHDQAAKATKEMENFSGRAEEILDRIQQVAAEQGVSQQAHYFRIAADEHRTGADTWLRRTIWMAIFLGVYAIGSLFFNKIPWLISDNLYQTIQITVSKILIFAVISYMLLVSARNYISHRHNFIINTHRQNALLTFQALVDSSKETANRDIILNHAAACIFTPQSTGYSKQSMPEGPSVPSIVGLMAKTAVESAS